MLLHTSCSSTLTSFGALPLVSPSSFRHDELLSYRLLFFQTFFLSLFLFHPTTRPRTPYRCGLSQLAFVYKDSRNRSRILFPSCVSKEQASSHIHTRTFLFPIHIVDYNLPCLFSTIKFCIDASPLIYVFKCIFSLLAY